MPGNKTKGAPKATDESPVQGDVSAEEATNELKVIKDSTPPEPKKVAQPDERAHHEAEEALRKTIADSHARLDKIKALFEKNSKENNRSDDGGLREKLKATKAQIRKAIDECKVMQSELKAAEDARNGWQAESQKVRGKLQYKTTGEIDAFVKKLEYQMSTTSMSVAEEKKIMAEINNLNKSKKEVKEVENCQDNIRSYKENIEALQTRLKAKNSEISELKSVDKQISDELDNQKKQSQKEFNPQALKKEENQLRGKIKATHAEIKTLKDEHMKKVNEWRKYQKVLYEQRQVERRKEAERRAEEKKQKQKEFEEEYGDILKDPYWKEQFELDNLVAYLTGLLPAKKDSAKAAEAAAVANASMDGMQMIGKFDDEEEVSFGKKKGKKHGARAPQERDEKIKHSLDAFSSFSKFSIAAPNLKSEVQTALDAVLAKKEYLKTAPPPEKKDKKDKKDKPASPVEVKVTATSGSTADVEVKINENEANSTKETASEE